MIVGRERTATGGIPASIWTDGAPFTAPYIGAGAGANEQALWWVNNDLTPKGPEVGPPDSAFFAGEATVGPTEHFGVTTLDLLFERVTAGKLEAFGVTISPYSFNAVTAGARETFGQVVLPLSFNEVTQAIITAFGKSDTPLNLNIVTAGAVEGQAVVTPIGASGGGPVLVISPRDILEMKRRRLRKDEEEVIQILTYLGYLPE